MTNVLNYLKIRKIDIAKVCRSLQALDYLIHFHSVAGTILHGTSEGNVGGDC